MLHPTKYKPKICEDWSLEKSKTKKEFTTLGCPGKGWIFRCREFKKSTSHRLSPSKMKPLLRPTMIIRDSRKRARRIFYSNCLVISFKGNTKMGMELQILKTNRSSKLSTVQLLPWLRSHLFHTTKDENILRNTQRVFTEQSSALPRRNMTRKDWRSQEIKNCKAKKW